MKLVINKAKRETIATYIHGASILILIFSFGYYIFLPMFKLINAEQILPINKIFSFTEIFRPVWGIILSGILFVLSKKLKIDTSYASVIYDKLGPGTLLLILLLLIWMFPMVFSFLIHLF